MALEDRIHGFAARYTTAPQWIKSLVGSAYALLPKRVRLGASYDFYQALFKEPGASTEYCRDRLRETLLQAVRFVPAYREFAHLEAEIVADPVAALARFPLMDKETIKHRLSNFLSVESGARRLPMFTGGSTAVPMTFYLTKGVSRAKEWAAFSVLADRFRTDGRGTALALRGRSVGTATRAGGRLWSYEPIKRQLILSSDHLEARYMEAYVDAIRQWRPAHIHAFPSALYPLVRWMYENDRCDLLESVEGVLLTSESVFPYQLALFRKVFRCPVIVHYGHTERVLFAHTLPVDSRYFFWPHYGHFELVDASGKSVTTPGEIGEIVGTSFDSKAMPFVRYRTGDFAVLSDRPPPPGYEGFPVCERIEGRVQEFVVCRDQRLISVTTLGAAHFEELERCARIQYEQHREGELLLRVVPLAGTRNVDTASIAAAVEEKTQGGCSVKVELVGEIPLTRQGKQRLLQQHLDISSYLGASIEAAGTASPQLQASSAADKGSARRRWFESTASGKTILMIGTDPDMRGGIASVVSVYRHAGAFDSGTVRYIASHTDGNAVSKLTAFSQSLVTVAGELISGRVCGVHVQSSSKGSFWRKAIILALARAFGIKTLFHLHSGGFDRFVDRSNWIAKRWVKRTLESSDGVIVLSKRWADWMSGFAPAAKVHILGNPIVVPVELSAAERTREVVFLGLICDAKGCFDLIKAFARIRSHFPEWKLIVGGNGETERFNREVALAELSEQIEFRGWIDSAARARLFDSASIYVLPSYAEGLPMGMLEAMAHGLPVVVSKVGGIPDTITDGVDGLLMSAGDIDDLVAQLEKLMGDPALRMSIGQAGRETAQNFAVDRILGRLEGIYQQIGMLASSAPSTTSSPLSGKQEI
ncbi:MAG: glycosyltransferase [Rhodocyclaceae bacterium]|nr:glycosyltransferase [Rhodocyclaceae bacterium]